MKGFSLLETMLALLVLSVGLLGITGMQLSGLKYLHESYFQSLAMARLSGMMDRLRVNTSPESRERELMRWNALNADLLPHGEGDYTCQTTSCTVNIRWTIDVPYTRSLSARVYP